MNPSPTAIPSGSNPILAGFAALARGENLETVLVWRDDQLPTPRAWIDAGWEALGHLSLADDKTIALVETMQQAWLALDDTERTARMEWVWGTAIGAQSLWREAYTQGHDP